MKKNELTATQEDYLEVIFQLIEEHRVARNKDIADKLDVKRATVTGAIKALGEKGLLNYESHGFITLTQRGRDIAVELLEKHELFTYFFSHILGIDDEEAEKIACGIEHSINGKALERFKELIESIESCRSIEKYCHNCNDEHEKK